MVKPFENEVPVDTTVVLSLPEAVPHSQRPPYVKPCPTCNKTHILMGFYEYNGRRFWVYTPGACFCWMKDEAWSRVTVEEPIS